MYRTRRNGFLRSGILLSAASMLTLTACSSDSVTGASSNESKAALSESKVAPAAVDAAAQRGATPQGRRSKGLIGAAISTSR